MHRLLAILALVLCAVAQASTPLDSIEETLDSEMPPSGVPGLAYGVVENGEIAALGSRGVAKQGTQTPISPDTPFLTGSISKSFTALAVMQLAEAAKLELDGQIGNYLPEFSATPASTITIRQLLSHTSGYSTRQGNLSHNDESGAQDELALWVHAIARMRPDGPPGVRWEYSNTNYQILGRLIEVVTGQRYQSYVESRILKPIGMNSSFVADGASHDSMPAGHRPWFGMKRVMRDSRTSLRTAPQGGVIASASDLARYMQTMMNGKDDILSANGKAEMMRPASGISPFYGLGWFIDQDNASVWHSGSSPGFETLLTMIPARRDGAVVLVNGGSGVGFGETAQLRNAVVAKAVGLDYSGEGSRFWQRLLFVALTILPLAYLFSMVWAWNHRNAIRAKTGVAGLFSLWFPLCTTFAAAWAMLSLVPNSLGAPLATIRQFQPDLGLLLIASALTGVAWAVFRLGVAYIPDANRFRR